MQLDHDFHVPADRVADLRERLQRLVEIGERMRVPFEASAAMSKGHIFIAADAFGFGGFWRGRQHCNARRAGPHTGLRWIYQP